jgi:hypothetical protein
MGNIIGYFLLIYVNFFYRFYGGILYWASSGSFSNAADLKNHEIAHLSRDFWQIDLHKIMLLFNYVYYTY